MLNEASLEPAHPSSMSSSIRTDISSVYLQQQEPHVKPNEQSVPLMDSLLHVSVCVCLSVFTFLKLPFFT